MAGTLVIINPRANKGRTADLRSLVEREMQGETARIVETMGRGDAAVLAAAAALDGCRHIVAIGGDGTLHEVANGIIRSGCPVTLGIVATGTGNDYARGALRLPLVLSAAIHTAFHGSPTPIDIARINTSYFLNSFGVGLDANVAWDVNEYLQAHTPFRGQLLYTISALRQIFMHYDRCPTLQIQIDEAPPICSRVILCAIQIGPTVGGGYRLNPRAEPSDGLLDLCLARIMPRLAALVAMQLARSGHHRILKEVSLLRCRKVILKAEVPVNAHIDGELLRGTEWEIEIVPGGMTVMLPA